MKKILKWIAIVLGTLIVVVAAAAFILYSTTSAKLTRVYDIKPAAVGIPTDAASIARGQHLVSIICVDCHGEDYSGTDFLNDPSLGAIHAANLTPGKGGAGSEFTDEDWVRAIRHGVDNRGRALIIMPSNAFYHMSDADLGASIAYLKSLPPVDKEWTAPSLAPMAQIMAGAGMFGTFLPVDGIPHAAPRPTAPAEGITAEYGEYMLNIMDCRACHGPDLAGGESGEPGAPPSPNITASGNLGSWSNDDFLKAMHSGILPSGKVMGEAMPWQTYGKMTDDELSAIFTYLKTLP